MRGLSFEMITITIICAVIIVRLWRMLLAVTLLLATVFLILGILWFVSYIAYHT
jgi:hypothetical protein